MILKSLFALTIASTSLIVFVALNPVSGPRLAPKKQLAYKEGEVLVKLSTKTMQAKGEQRFALRHRAQSLKRLNSKGLMKVKLPAGESVENAIASMKNDPDLESVQPNFRYHKTAVPNDTSYASLWGLKNTGQTIAAPVYATNNPGTAGRDMNAEDGWDINTDCSSVTVAVIDTGINYTHNDLVANMWDGTAAGYPNHGYDFVDSDNDPVDLDGHGTHVAGTIGAVGNNGTGVTGVCWDANLMAVRVLDENGSGFTSDVVLGINFAVAQGAKVINLSLGSTSNDAALTSAVQAASNAGVVLIAAAGNSGTNNTTTPFYPCNITSSNLLCVAAMDQSYALASFSNFSSTAVDVGAPGTNILSTYHGTVVNDTDLTGWTTSPDATWVNKNVTLGGTVYNMLVNPTQWDTGLADYDNNLDARIYKTFNIAGADLATLTFYAFVDTETSTDFFNVNYRAAGGDPFTAGVQLESFDGSTNNTAISHSYNITPCIGATCSIGFQLTSNGSITDYGIGLLRFTLSSTTLNNSTYVLLNGTSMASPQVAGIAASLFTYNPAYTAADVIASLKGGGTAVSALSGKSTTGKVADLLGSLSHINAPTGVSAVVQE